MIEKVKLKLFALILPLLGFIFGSLILTPINPVYAVPEDTEISEETTTNNTDESTENNKQDEEQKDETNTNEQSNKENSTENCHEQAGALGWIICPTSGVIAKAIDSIYGIIESFLVVDPISTDTESPVYIVWEYTRNITNIVFVIFLLIIIYSQITGIGLNNYHIKKTLPRIIIAAIFVNLSYLICSAVVDISNVLGASFNGFFNSITENVAAKSEFTSSFSWVGIVGTVLAGTVALGGATILAGGLSFLWMLIPVLIGGIISIAVGLAMISMRQALIILLVMVSPAAFVAYLLPNTEKWFNKWKELFTAMLVFYPMFSVLFGASKLAGLTIIASAKNPFWIILGMAVQILPLFFSVKLMTTSKTFLGSVGQKLNNLGNGVRNSSRGYASQKRDTSRQQYYANKIQKHPNSLSARVAMSRIRRADRLNNANEQFSNVAGQRLNELKDGKRVIGVNKDGKPIYKTVTTPEMKREYKKRVSALSAANAAASVENHMGTMKDYMKETGIKDDNLLSLANQQAENYLESQTLASAARRNDRADKRFYFDKVAKAAERDEQGNLKDTEAYERLVKRGAGADVWSDDEKIRRDATTTVVADAYDMFEAERKVTTAKYTTYLDKQVSAEVNKIYDQMLEDRNIDGIVAAQSVTAKRGDYDKIEARLRKYMDQEGYVEIGTDFANTLALSLLGLKDAAPDLGRLGKHINVETARFMNGERASKYITMKEYYTGFDSEGGTTKFNAQVLMQGTGLKNIDRTFFDGISESINQYFTTENYAGDANAAQAARDLTFTNMAPQLISAIGTFSSGSDQMKSSMGFITGAKYDSASDTWSIKPGQSAQETKDYAFRTQKYLNFLTAQNVIDMKTDTFNAIITRLADNIGDTSKDRSAAKQEFYNILDNRGIVKQLQATDPSFINNMRPGIRKTLGL